MRLNVNDLARTCARARARTRALRAYIIALLAGGAARATFARYISW